VSTARDCPLAVAMVASSPSGRSVGAEAPDGGKGKMSRDAVVAIVASGVVGGSSRGRSVAEPPKNTGPGCTDLLC